MIDSISVIFYKGNIFIPTEARTKSGLYQAIDPVYVVPLEIDSFVQAMRAVIKKGHPQVKGTPYSEYRKRDPILRATKARSWKTLARDGLAYSIIWRPDLGEVQIDLPEVDKKGRFAPLTTENMEWRIVRFPIDISLEELAEFIIEDIRKRKGMA